MTPEARIGSAVDILDRVIAGEPAERALTNWARGHRFAGSRDRAAIRDHVYDALRRRRSALALSGQAEEGGRALMIGLLAEEGADPATVFTGQGYAPAPLSAAEAQALAAAPAPGDLPEAVALDVPDWLVDPLKQRLGADYARAMAVMRSRAPVFLRVNAQRAGREGAQAALAAEGIVTRASPQAKFALEVVEGASRIRNSASYIGGLVEVQDLSPQAAVERLPLKPGQRVLDYCAGGGGKVLAMAAQVPGTWFAHDADPRRMADLPARAARAGVTVRQLAPGSVAAAGPFDLVLADVPCSGTGTWRRTPEAKWTLTPARLQTLLHTQAAILDAAAALVGPKGTLAYMTCSLLEDENGAQVAAFLDRSPGFGLEFEQGYGPPDGGDGFHLACLKRL